MKNCNSRFLLIVISLILSVSNFAQAESFDDMVNQYTVEMIKDNMIAQGYSEDEFSIEIEEDGSFRVTINQTTNDQVLPEPTSSSGTPTSSNNDENIAAADYESYYNQGLEYEQSGDWISAVSSYVASNGYSDSAERILPYLEDYVYEMLDAEEYKQAQSALLLCNDPKYDDLLAECNDYCFPLDLASALAARWNTDDTTDTSIMSDKRFREFIASLINEELSYIDKYASMTFADEKMAQYAYAYLGALQSQLVGIEYYGIDAEAYEEYYATYGYYVRAQMIYLINRMYGIEVPEKHFKTLKEVVEVGEFIDWEQSVARMLNEQLRDAAITFDPPSYGCINGILEFSPIVNTSNYDILYLDISLNLIDDNGKVMDSQSLLFSEELKVGESAEITSPSYIYIDEPFSGIAYAYSFYFKTSSYADVGEGTVMPRQQWFFDGNRLFTNDRSAATLEVPAYAIESVSSGWGMKDSYYENLYVPNISFTLRNTSSVDAEEVTVECVFVDKNTKVEWDNVSVHVASQSTAPLKAGYGREIKVISDSGFERRTSDVPNLVAEIYVNNEALGVFDIEP